MNLLHQNQKKLFASEARLAFLSGGVPGSPAPRPTPGPTSNPPETHPERTEPGSQIEPMRQEGLHTILAAERLNEQQQISALRNSAEELFSEIEERLLVPINGAERDRFEQKKRQALESLDNNSRLLIGWRREHPNIRIQPPRQGLRTIMLSDLSLEERSSQLNEYADSFETSGEDITEEAKNRMKTILKQYFGALIPLIQDIQKVERKEAIAQLPDNLRQAFQRLQADPAYASLLFDSRRSLERFPQEARDAIRRYRELRARAEVRSASPRATTAPAEGTSGTPRTRSPESSGGRTWDKLMEFIEEILEMLVGYEIAKRTGDISAIRRERRGETAPATAQHIIDGVNAQNPLEVNRTNDNRLEAQVSGKNIMAPQDGEVALAENPQGKKLFFFPNNSDRVISISVQADAIQFPNIGLQWFDEERIPISRLEKKQVPAGSIIADHVNGTLLFGMLTTSGSTLPISETLSYFRGFMRERTTATPRPVAVPAEGSRAAPVPAANTPGQTERIPNTPRERRAEARRTYETLKTLAEEAKNLQGSDVCKVAINALANADSRSLEALWRQFPRNPDQQAYETFQRETANLRTKLQAWKEYPELARRAQVRRVVLQQAGPESSDEAGNTARQNIVTVVEALKNALQALPQAVAAQTPPPRPVSVETGMRDSPPTTPQERRWEIEHRVTAIDGLRVAAQSNRSDITTRHIDKIFRGLSGDLRTFPRNPTQEQYEAFLVKINNTQRQLLAWRDLPDLLARAQRLNQSLPAGIENLEASTDAGNQARENIVAVVDALRSTVNPSASVAATPASPPTAAATPAPAPPATPSAPAATPPPASPATPSPS